MQELMDEFAKKADSLPDTLDANVAYLAFQECYDMAKSMLKKEMSVIIEAFHEGMRCQGWDPNRGIAEEYYNETFNTEECYHKGKYTYNKETFECHKCGLIVPNEYRFNTKEK